MADAPTPPASSDPLSGTDKAAAALILLFSTAEAAILAKFGGVIASSPATPAGQAALRGRLAHVIRQVLGQVTPRLPAAVRDLAQTAVADGIAHAETVHPPHDDPGYRHAGQHLPPPPTHPGVGHHLPSPDPYQGHGRHAAQVLQADLQRTVRGVLDSVTRAADDVYREVTAAAANAEVLGLTPQAAQAQAWSDYAARGVTGFTDVSGRRWALSSYVEMSVRTTSLRAFNAAYEERLTSLGVRYFTVPGDGHPCPLCLPWQGTVLTVGANPDPEVHTDGTITEARAAGLFHPQCRHVLVAYFPGVTMTDARATWNDEHQARYDATQRLRALERRVRQARQVHRFAATPAEATKARRAIREAQQAVQAHVFGHDLVRRPRREQIDLGLRAH